MPEVRDIPFAEVSGERLFLDLFLPDSPAQAPLVVFIHGGGWWKGSRKECPLAWIVRHGYALASIDYRLTGRAVFPAQIFDCKGAVRWLRAHAAEHGYDASRIAAAGVSAGGHLALLLGTSAGVKELEGNVGGNLDQSSRVQAVVNYYGPTDFILRAQTQATKTETPESPVHRLLGGPVRANEAAAQFASGAHHVTKDAPPLLVFHGTEDKTVLMDQAQRICDRYKVHGLDVTLHIVEGAGHGSDMFFADPNGQRLIRFLDTHLSIMRT